MATTTKTETTKVPEKLQVQLLRGPRPLRFYDLNGNAYDLVSRGNGRYELMPVKKEN